MNYTTAVPKWCDDDELFMLCREGLFSAVIGDVMDIMGRTHQFLPPRIQPLRDDMVLVGRAMRVLEADDPERSFPLCLLAMNQKRFHGMYFVVNDSRKQLACTIEYITGGVDLQTRRTAPFPDELLAGLKTQLSRHARLDWAAPVCGAMQV